MAHRCARAQEAVRRLRASRLQDVRPSRQDPERARRHRCPRASPQGRQNRGGSPENPPRSAPGATQRHQRRLLGLGGIDRSRYPESSVYLLVRHLARCGMDGARARIARGPSHHPARLGMERPRAWQEAPAPGQAMSSEYVPGLEGIIAARTEISLVDGANGRLVYRGYVIADLAEEMSFEEVAYLLWNGSLPKRAELDALAREMAASRALTGPAMATLEALPQDTDPMDVLRSVVSVQGVEHKLQKPTIPLAIHATASFPTILASFHRRSLGLEPVKPRADLAQAANYLYMLNGIESPPELVRALNTYLVLLADHGMNASTFTARVIASTDSDLASCLVGALGALKGPAHGGAPSAVLDQLEQIGSPENAEPWMRESRQRQERFMGFGHRIYRTYDPRAKILKAMCEKLNPKFYALASKVEETALAILHEEHPERPQATNIEFYSAGVLPAIGLPKDLFPPTFAVSRVAGWTAHVLEQAAHNRLIRPQSEYVGPEPRKPIPLAERG